MTVKRGLMVAALAVIGSGACVSTARADGFISPFVGVNFGGDAAGTFNGNLSDRNQATYGLTLSGMSAGVFGAELDVGYSPRFYGGGPLVGGNSLLTVMPSLIFGIPLGGQHGFGIRPYATAGFGLVKRNLTISGLDIFNGSDPAYSVGGGLLLYFSDHVGLKGDYKYFRNVKVDEVNLGNLAFRRGTFDFSRATVGLVFRFSNGGVSGGASVNRTNLDSSSQAVNAR